ncbi:hypothetical protein Q4511_03600 [Paracoccus sp. 1_MG-2023]|uniref:hypothetical protein n=1 Tax=unclassified Paracoccus (in: a-proteobacteria) TaxID=2688777 RepID=UPI001C094D4A|nr:MULTISPECIES: hypothetical protein [unclassified Paracoccus (in: a-proteobacteria)]MBU2956321.1 hypothetical protein [Paracoccus sp. C2R09]MDO6667997.1 hypothetical protein [Paracoccus sp. 1_MG-2023]
MMTKTMTALTTAMLMAGTATFAQTEPATAPDPVDSAAEATSMDQPIQTGASTDGDEPPTETVNSTDLSGDDIIPLDAETGSTDGTEYDPIEDSIPAEAAVEVEGDTGLEEDGGAETSGMSEGEDLN